MNKNEHTRECSFSENTRFPAENSIFVKTNIKIRETISEREAKTKQILDDIFDSRNH